MQVRKAKCNNCQYKWETKSKRLNVTCPNCLRKVLVTIEEIKGATQ